MEKRPKFSFYIPVYKKPEEVFRKCLASLFDMSVKDIEVIVVFDGSDPTLENVLTEFPQTKKIVIDHAGAPAARNAGLAAATGEYVVAWDADCYAKPEMANRWLQEFKEVPEADFVYTGYEFAGEQGGFDSEPFDAYSLTCGNYICSMSPIKKEKAGKWDETLPAAQDWDYWLTRVEEGCKGAYIPGAGFITDTIREGMSSSAWKGEKREETIRRVREKHGIVNRKIGVFSMSYRERALKIAEALGGDWMKPTGPNFDDYTTILNFGYSFMSRFEDVPQGTIKIQYWIPSEIAGLAEAKYSTVKETIRISKEVINLCNTQYEKNKLEDLGIEAQVVPLPFLKRDLAKIQKDIPEKFSVLVLTDEAYGKLIQEIEGDLPHINFTFNQGAVKDHSCVVSLYSFAALDDALLTALINGRNVISNVQAPFCGFVDPDQTWEAFKKDLYESIRIAKGRLFNKEAQDYYLQIANPDEFKRRIDSFQDVKLEVLV